MRKKGIGSKVLASCLAAALVMGCLVGCGSSDKPADTADTSASADAEDKAEAPADDAAAEEEVVLTIMSSLQTEAEGALELAYADAFMELHPNIKIEFIGVSSNDIYTQVLTMSSGNNLPDAWTCFVDQIASYADMGILANAEDVLSDDFMGNVLDSVVDEFTYDGAMAVAPIFVVPTALIYRTDWLADSGYDKIETWEDFEGVAKAFTTDSTWGFSMVGSNDASGFSRFKQYTRSFGILEAYQDDAGTWVTDLTSDAYADALQSWCDLALEDEVVPPGASEATYSVAANYFALEQTGLMITGSNAIGVILSSNPDLTGLIGSTAVPSGTQHVSSLNPTGYAISSECEHPEELAMFLEFLASDENSIDFASQTGRLPVTKSASENEMFADPMYAGFIDALQYAIKDPTSGNGTELLTAMAESYSSVLGGSATVDEACATLTETVDKLIAEANE